MVEQFASHPIFPMILSMIVIFKWIFFRGIDHLDAGTEPLLLFFRCLSLLYAIKITTVNELVLVKLMLVMSTVQYVST